MAPDERSWDQRILDVIPSGVDETLIGENLRLTPGQRVEQMIALLESVEEIQDRNGHPVPKPA